ncbi:MAG: hypothetical protein V8R75_15225 [Oscillospiraceae bacterium]
MNRLSPGSSALPVIAVTTILKGSPKTVSEYLRAGEYLAELGKTITGKKGQYIEVELNQSDGKAYIRDNLQHEDMSHVMDQNAAGNDKPEYGTVLGWQPTMRRYPQRIALPSSETVVRKAQW